MLHSPVLSLASWPCCRGFFPGEAVIRNVPSWWGPRRIDWLQTLETASYGYLTGGNVRTEPPPTSSFNPARRHRIQYAHRDTSWRAFAME
ncbi:uncharacterized protein F5Z01DRAFT_38175 [Emericellopsis atlantica]|uniref:Uncharacterized protein n=1 Tax=Emericellopsis atlantica TaxID=2614577 RepID=A0A9P7ZN65_9HYPO|nr:uncharacterized protein F5Z01DRAFT_38175 [Emericellopsis atlantica]KAG9255204.1 hypothetical protein F5Z01DRAFT_38175 [Emericellopsis atlantica]